MIIKMVDLYSYWMTTHFILYKSLGKWLPKWISPFPSLFIGFFIQLYIFYAGRNTLKWQIILAVFIWKISMLLFTKANWLFNTIIFNIILLLVYLLFLNLRGISFIRLYNDEIYKTEKEHKTIYDFIKFRINNIY